MIEAKYTQDGLPVVTIETCQTYSFLVERLNLDFNTLLKEYRERLQKENPILCEALSNLIVPLFKEDYGEKAASILFGSFITYEFLRRQAEANKLEKELGQQ